MGINIGFIKGRDREKEQNQQAAAILNNDTPFHVKEAYKALRTNIMFSLPEEGCKVVAVTSPLPADGKSVTAFNLSVTFSQTGNRVLLIDGDMRRSNIRLIEPCDINIGLSEVLARFAGLEDAIVQTSHDNLSIIYGGDIPPNPAELLSSDMMKKILDDLRSRFDYIFIDMAPINVVTDAAVVSGLINGVILVVRHNVSRREDLLEAVRRLRFVNAKILGAVINNKEFQTKSKYYRYSKYNNI